MKRVSIDNFKGGVIDKVNPQKIPDNALTEVKNYEYRKTPILRKRFSTDEAELNEAKLEDIYNFDVWYPNKPLDDMYDDKIFVLHTMGDVESGGGGGGDEDADPYLTIDPSNIDFGYVLVGETSTDTWTVTGGYLLGDVELVSTNAKYTICTTEDGTYASSVTLTPTNGSVSQTMYVKYTPDSNETDGGTVTHNTFGVSELTLTLTAVGAEFPTDDILFRLENWSNLVARAEPNDAFVDYWTSIQPVFDFACRETNYSVGDDYFFTPSISSEEIAGSPAVHIAPVTYNETDYASFLSKVQFTTTLEGATGTSIVALVKFETNTVNIGATGRGGCITEIRHYYGTTTGDQAINAIEYPVNEAGDVKNYTKMVIHGYDGSASHWTIKTIDIPTSLVDDEWHLIMGIVDYTGKTLKLYIDGVLISTETSSNWDTAIPNSSQYDGANVGAGVRMYNNKYPVYGMQGHVAMSCGWKRILTSAEITNILNYVRAKYELFT